MNYQQEYQKSIQQKEQFWQQKAKDLPWFKFPQNILSQDEHGIHHWFADGQMNTSYMALDYHVENGRGQQTALIYDSPVSNTKKKYTYSQLRDQVALCAGMIKAQGVNKGDVVIIYMPMVPEAAIAMLACARLGAIHSVVFGGFAAPELAIRIDDSKPKCIISASCGIEINRIIPYKPLLDQAIELASHKPSSCIILQRQQLKAKLKPNYDYSWADEIKQAKPTEPVALRGDDLIYILYTSGTTGKPKGVVRENGGHAVALKYSMKAIYNTEPGEVYFAASDVGWVVGHSYIVYGPLLHGCSTILYEGKPVMTPDGGAFWRLIEEYKINALFTAPTAYRAIKKEDPDGKLIKKYDISSLKNLFAAGERLDPPTYEWLNNNLPVNVIDNWWQTETGWAIASNQTGIEPMPIKPGSATVPSAGFEVEILDDNGNQVGPNTQGNIAIKLPLPPSCLTTIWGDMAAFKASYLETFPGFYLSGDGGYFDQDGYLFVMGRTDDIINISGHRLSTGEMEEVIAKNKAVAECAVIGVADEIKGQLPLGFVILKSGTSITPSELNQQIVKSIRAKIGAIACYKKTVVVDRLPKTRSGKILRKTMRLIADGQDYTIPSTIDDPNSLDEIKQYLEQQR